MARQGDQKERVISVDSRDFSYVDLDSTIAGWRVKATRKDVTLECKVMGTLGQPINEKQEVSWQTWAFCLGTLLLGMLFWACCARRPYLFTQ